MDGEWLAVEGPVRYMQEWLGISFAGETPPPAATRPRVETYELKKWMGCWDAAPTFRYVRREP